MQISNNQNIDLTVTVTVVVSVTTRVPNVAAPVTVTG
jgi:hypothetical protein